MNWWVRNIKTFVAFYYIENVLILVSTVSISGFVSLNDIPVGIANFAVGLAIWVITPGIKNYKSIIKEIKKTW